MKMRFTPVDTKAGTITKKEDGLSANGGAAAWTCCVCGYERKDEYRKGDPRCIYLYQIAIVKHSIKRRIVVTTHTSLGSPFTSICSGKGHAPLVVL